VERSVRPSREAGDTTSYVMGGSATIGKGAEGVKGPHTNGVSSTGTTNDGMKQGQLAELGV